MAGQPAEYLQTPESEIGHPLTLASLETEGGEGWPPPGKAKGFLVGASVLGLSEETAPAEVRLCLRRQELRLLRVRVRMRASGPERAAE